MVYLSSRPRFTLQRNNSNPRNNMSSGDVARAVRNLQNACVPIADSYYELNHWQ